MNRLINALRIELCLAALLVVGCSKGKQDNSANAIRLANQFVDAFYSFDRDSLQSILSEARESQPNILYYQKWAECGNYRIIDRTKYFVKNDSIVMFPVTVEDDLMKALEIDFHVTDTFRIAILRGRIRSVETSSNDLAIYHEAKEWVKVNRPDLVAIACEGIWNGGPTPCECLSGFVAGFRNFVKVKKSALSKQ